MTKNRMDLCFWVLFLLLNLAIITDEQCIQGQIVTVNVGLQNGILPTNVAEYVLGHKAQKKVQSIETVSTVGNWTMQSGRFLFKVKEGPISAILNSDGSGTITVIKNVEFTIQITFLQGDYKLQGAALIDSCPLQYSFVLNEQEAPVFYNLTMSASDVSFNIQDCLITSVQLNFDSTQSQSDDIISNLNSNKVIQGALAMHYQNLSTILVNQVVQQTPQNLPTLSIDFPRRQQRTTSVKVSPTMVSFMVNISAAPSYAAGFNVTLPGLVQNQSVCQASNLINNQTTQSLTRYSNQLIQNVFNQQFNSQFFSSLLNSIVWPVRYLPWFTGGWTDIDQTIYALNPMNTFAQGFCQTVGPAPQFSVGNPGTSSNTISFSLFYNCSLVTGNQTSTISLQMVANISPGFTPDGLMFMFVQSVDSVQVSTSLSGSATVSLYVNDAINSLFVGTHIILPLDNRLPNGDLEYTFTDADLVVHLQ